VYVQVVSKHSSEYLSYSRISSKLDNFLNYQIACMQFVMVVSKTSLLRGMLFFWSQVQSTVPIDLNWTEFPYPLSWVSVITFVAVYPVTEPLPQSTQLNPEGRDSVFF
jgi:hypothetical protein